MNGERIDPRVERTRRAIKDAFRELVCEKDAGRITVKELTERAGINRKTFYLHFELSVLFVRSSVVAAVKEDFLKTFDLSEEMTADMVRARGPVHRAVRYFLRLFSPAF